MNKPPAVPKLWGIWYVEDGVPEWLRFFGLCSPISAFTSKTKAEGAVKVLCELDEGTKYFVAPLSVEAARQ